MDMNQVRAFFYGLYLEPSYSRSLGVRLEKPCLGFVEGWEVELHGRIKLIEKEGAQAWGMLYEVRLGDLQVMYEVEAAREYRPFELEVTLLDGSKIQAKCYNLQPEPGAKLNREYLEKLLPLLENYGFPREYQEELRGLLRGDGGETGI